MRILGIHIGHNATVALLDNGEVKAVLSQEKFDNIKNSAGFPFDAIEAIFKTWGISPKDIDKIAFAGKEVWPQSSFEYLFKDKSSKYKRSNLIYSLLRVSKTIIQKIDCFKIFSYVRRHCILKRGFKEFKDNLAKINLSGVPIEYVDHHTCHARAAYHALNPIDNKQASLVFTLDGSGDNISASVIKVEEGGNKWDLLATTNARASLGGIYTNTTKFLGMKILEHEYKVMGLAPYCKKYYLETYKNIFESIIDLDPKNNLQFRSTVDAAKFYGYLCKHAVGERFDNIAGAVQHLIEDRVVNWIKYAIHSTNVKRVFTGGGVFMNVKLNKKIQEITDIDEVKFLPSCGDESNALGAAYHVAIKNNISLKPISNLYLGIEYTDNELEQFIINNNLAKKYKVEFFENIEHIIAEKLANKEIVARFSGRYEWGARALGNRSILAHPSHLESFYMVNDFIKCRDFWMPFAPSILDCAAHKYLKNLNLAKTEPLYMITAYDATEEGIDKLRAALHQGDHTLRPQLVRADMNPKYYSLIKHFESLTGVGAVLNTSLNLHGFPLVANPEQALTTFEHSQLQHLSLGSWIISKQ